ncbi:uncharacterized protein LOC123565314 [Mercenaria mercenaria]|uniref:uncharacterized protein LOC123565314 n=1 Tax=Mercenaria mercenaria TaxID=6596 RepID=UPI00234F246B|nr:uncharacterized protein LOC123565314 [Mercenaria mercenaria]
MDRKRVIDHLKCPLCSDFFENPKQLPCGHNICERCLKCHITRTVPMIGYNIFDFLDGNNPDIKPSEQSFKCPFDGEKLTPQDPNQEVGKWAYQFENNLKIVTLIDICRGKVRCLIEECDNCIEVSQKVAATSVCFTCIEKYCVKCAFIHRHTHSNDLMFNLSAIQSVLIENPSAVSPLINCTANETCKIHLFSEMHLYCSDCNEKCCKKCQQTIHSECQHVSKLAGEYTEYQTNGTLTKLVDRFKEVSDQTSEILKNDLDLLDNVQELAQSGNETKNIQFDDMINNLRCQITRWEVHYEHVQRSLKQVENYIAAPAGANAHGIIQIGIECQQLEKEIDYHKKLEMDNSVRLRKFRDALERQKHEDARKRENKNKYGKKAKLPNKSNKNDAKLDNVDFEKLLKFKTEDKIVDITQKVKLVEKFNMKSDDDTEDCWLTDCLFLNVSFIVAVDNANKCIKWILEDRKVNKLVLQSGPQCIAVNIEQGHIGCVTLPHDKTIQLFFIEDSMIYLTQQLVTKEQCYGVDFAGSNIVVSCTDHSRSSVKILSMNGVEVRRISCSVDFLKERLFCDPRYVTVQQSGEEVKLYVTDFRLCNVTCLSLEGILGQMTTERLIHNKMGFPLGLDMDVDGNILVCCNSMGSVHQITNGSERQHRLLVQSLYQPRAVSALKRGNMFIVTSDSGPYKNHVLVHEFISKAC